MTDYLCESGQCVEITDTEVLVLLTATELDNDGPTWMTYAEFADFANDVHAGRYADIEAKGLAEKLRRAGAAK